MTVGSTSKQAPTLTEPPPRLEGESESAYARRLAAFLAGDDVRSKADNRDWTGSLPFHLDKP